MHICANTILEEQDSKVRQKHQQLSYKPSSTWFSAHSSLPQTASGSVPPFFHGSALYSTHRPRNVRRLYSNRHRCGLKITNDRRIAYSHIDIRSFISELSSRISLYSFKSIKFATIRSTYPSENSTGVVTNGNATNIHRSWLNCLSFGLLACVRDTSPDKKKVQRCCLTIDQYNQNFTVGSRAAYAGAD